MTNLDDYLPEPDESNPIYHDPARKNEVHDVDIELWWCDTRNWWECEGQLMNGVPCPEHGS